MLQRRRGRVFWFRRVKENYQIDSTTAVLMHNRIPARMRRNYNVLNYFLALRAARDLPRH